MLGTSPSKAEIRSKMPDALLFDFLRTALPISGEDQGLV
jgi:hypothetical protein